ncbi:MULTISPECIES: hypothetical protein [Bacillus cereus group]|uniref:hypothetical protein n=1 Tax=Bacillus cereus group TaxID=86661 RepID=UPI0011659331|nr:MULTISPECIES: hypothetical protein [Bacillus cereus group]MBE5096685.1 hypothetical protein [Bacillus thuringiensis]QDD86859.1 hypothetical protein FORC087_068 [Bacillus cereus]
MDKKEIAKDLTVAFLHYQSSRVRDIDAAVNVYEKFYEAVNRSEFDYIESVNYVRDTKE